MHHMLILKGHGIFFPIINVVPGEKKYVEEEQWCHVTIIVWILIWVKVHLNYYVYLVIVFNVHTKLTMNGLLGKNIQNSQVINL